MAPKIYIGTSGWHYEHWHKLFYPQGLPKSKWLAFYAQHFTTVELNNSFYRLPTDKAFVTWRESSPPGFVFSVKVSRFITHIRKLRNVEVALENFIARASLLREKLGPLLYQLPPNLKRTNEVLKAFLSLLPKGYHHVFEFRNESWIDDDVLAILHRYNAGFCIFDMPDFTSPLVVTSDFAYIRFHGSTGLYWSCYSDEELLGWARKITNLAQGLKEIYIYFNNDAGAFAIKNAHTLAQFLEGTSLD